MTMRSFLKLFAVVLGVLAGIIIVFFFLKKRSPPAPSLNTISDTLNTIRDVHATDRYGGTTPDEALLFFTRELAAGDTDRAARYVTIEKQDSVKKMLAEGSRRGTLAIFVALLRQATRGTQLGDAAYEFSVPSGDGAGFTVDLVQDSESHLWKIDGF